METELKLQIDPGDIPILRRHLDRTKGARSTPSQLLVSIYFDTPDLLLSRHGCGLRVRKTRQGWTQTLKRSRKETAGLYERDEWESPVKGPSPEPMTLAGLVEREGKLSRFLTSIDHAGQLAPIFHMSIRRKIWHILTAQGDEMELALDQGVIEAGTARRSVHELEFELKAGNPAALFDMALALQLEIGLRVSNQSKAGIGYGLYAPQSSPAIKNKPVHLPSTVSQTEAIRIIVGNCLEQIRSNEIGVVHEAEPEYVHQMRIGLRRLRLALDMFKKIAPHSDELQKDLEWVAAALGRTRNWEVLAFGTLATVRHAFADESEWKALDIAARNAAARHRRHAARVIGSKRYARLLLRLGQWLESQQAGPAAQHGQDASSWHTSWTSIGKFSSRILDRYRRRLQRRGDALAGSNSLALHRVRIAAKKLRYATEFLCSVHAPRKGRSRTGPLSELLSTLGTFNDISCAGGLLCELAKLDPQVTKGACFARGYLASHAEMSERKVTRIWRRFSHDDPKLRENGKT